MSQSQLSDINTRNNRFPFPILLITSYNQHTRYRSHTAMSTASTSKPSSPSAPATVIHADDRSFYYSPSVPCMLTDPYCIQHSPHTSPISSLILHPSTPPRSKRKHAHKSQPRPLPTLPALHPIWEPTIPDWITHRSTQSEEVRSVDHERLLEENKKLAEALSVYLREKEQLPKIRRPASMPMLREYPSPRPWWKTLVERVRSYFEW